MKKFIKDCIIGTMYLFGTAMFLATLVITLYKLAGR